MMEDNEQFGQTPTLRDQFAMAALTGYIANNEFGFMTAKDVAEHCYASADAMLAERGK